jgi:hypothetical protein
MENGKQSAFPLDGEVSNQCGNGTNPTGLTKREYFAGLAMQGLLANANEHITYLPDDEIIKSSIQYADELLKQLEE